MVPADHPDGTRPLVTVARREDVVVGVGWGWTAGPVAELVGVQVAAGADGTDGHVRARLALGRRRPGRVAEPRPDPGPVRGSGVRG